MIGLKHNSILKLGANVYRCGEDSFALTAVSYNNIKYNKGYIGNLYISKIKQFHIKYKYLQRMTGSICKYANLPAPVWTKLPKGSSGCFSQVAGAISKEFLWSTTLQNTDIPGLCVVLCLNK
jgi:hypothetical protein